MGKLSYIRRKLKTIVCICLPSLSRQSLSHRIILSHFKVGGNWTFHIVPSFPSSLLPLFLTSSLPPFLPSSLFLFHLLIYFHSLYHFRDTYKHIHWLNSCLHFQFFLYIMNVCKDIPLTDIMYTMEILINAANNQYPIKLLMMLIFIFNIHIVPFSWIFLSHLTAYKFINLNFLSLSLLFFSEQQSIQIKRQSTGKLTDMRFIRASLSAPLKPVWKHH